MSSVARAVCVAVIVALCGCSFVASGADGWRPAHGPPDCNPMPALVVDGVVLGGAAALGTAAALSDCYDIECLGRGLAIGMYSLIGLVEVVAVADGSGKVFQCRQAKRDWARARDGVEPQLARELGADVAIVASSGTLVLQSDDQSALCTSSAWMAPVRSRAAMLGARGVKTVECRRGGSLVVSLGLRDILAVSPAATPRSAPPAW